MHRVLRILANTALVLGSIGISLVVLELILYQTPMRSLLVSLDNPDTYYVSDPLLKYDIRPNAASTTVAFYEHPYEAWSNAQGCFDTPYTGETPYIYLTGDSFTWGFAPFEDKWGTEMQQLLSTRVLKCGVYGYGTEQEYIKTSRNLASLPSPELIVVGYFSNDVTDDDSLAAWRSMGNDAPCGRSEPKHVNVYMPCFLVYNWFETHSIIYNALLSIVANAVAGSASVEPTPEQYAENFAHVQAFQELAQKDHSRLLMVLIPNETTVREQQPTPYDQLEAFLDRQKIPYVDLTPDLERAYASSSVPIYWYYDSHWNIAGNQLAGLLITQYILEHDLVSVSDERRVADLRAIHTALATFSIQ